MSLNGTLNPDFGQVEADPAVLNLGVFETFNEEKRPFFLEGNSIYRYSGPGIVATDNPARLFHSRRIGRRPNRFGTDDDTEIIDRPDGTTITNVPLNVAKIAEALRVSDKQWQDRMARNKKRSKR